MKTSVCKQLVAAIAMVSGLALAPAQAQTQAQTQTQTQTQTPRASATTAAKPAQQQTPAQRMYGDIAPKFAEITDNVLYADVWERPGLSKRDRSLITVSALVAMNRPDQLRSHLQRARDNGLSEAELVEAITHLAFYGGWPNAVTAIAVAKEVFKKK